MLTIDALKNLAVAMGYAPDVNSITANNVADVIEFMADATSCMTTFSATPAGAEIVVKKGTAVVHPDANGVYRLIKGSYTYTATAEGYTTQTDVALTVSANDVTTGTKTVTVTMVAVEG